MAIGVIYTDTTNKYDTQTSGIQQGSQNFSTKLNNTINSVSGAFIGLLGTLLPFEKLTSLKNERLRDEQQAGLSGDEIQTQADQKLMIGVVALVVVIAIVFVIIKKKK
ncbi:MAG: hypothetical protein JXR36_01260 [Bacteroidales bacterium]|nr:hypothetical protein [Bacteroidales bacterium]